MAGTLRSIQSFFSARTILARFWWAFFCVTVISFSVFIWVVTFATENYEDIRLQRLNWSLAANIASHLSTSLESYADESKVLEQLHAVTALHPGIEVFILDDRGEPIFSLRSSNLSSVDTKPLEQFLNLQGAPSKPIYAEHPASLDELSGEVIYRVFSVAPLPVAESPGYLYVVLGGSQFLALRQMYGETTLGQVGSMLLISAIIISSVLGLLLFFLLTRRIRTMTGVVQLFASGDYAQRIDDSSADEIGGYADAFNQMADIIVDNIEEIEQQDSLRRQLVANVSHELRRPVALMKLSLETLVKQSTQWNSVEQQNYVQTALSGCTNLSKLINDLFELSKLSSSESPASLEACDLIELVDDLLIELRGLADKNNVILGFDCPDELPLVQADPDLLQRVLLNLLENAIYYTPSGGKVQVALSSTENAVTVEIIDSGIGIPAELVPQIADRFIRDDRAREMRPDGSGLGLAIAKRAIELHAHQLEIQSEIDQGTTVRFQLDLA